MERDDLLLLLKTQAVLGRTEDGWDLGQGMVDASSQSVAQAESGEFVGKRCLNCMFASSGEYFVAGCPNCGCKDHEPLTVT